MDAFFDADTRPLGLQLYTLGEQVQDDFEGVLQQVAAIGYRDIELPGLYGRAPADASAGLRKAGLRLGSLHVAPTPGLGREPLTLQNDASEIIDYLGELGVNQVVAPMAPFPDNFQRPDDPANTLQALSQSYVDAGQEYWQRFAALLNEKALALKPAGITLGYHNHNFEFAPLGDGTGWDILARETDRELVYFEVDTGWVAAAGIDPVTFLENHAGRVRWLHLKDIAPSTSTNHALSMDPTEVGSGKLDWPDILATARSTGVQHYYVEQEPPFELPRLESIERSYAFLARLEV